MRPDMRLDMKAIAGVARGVRGRGKEGSPDKVRRALQNLDKRRSVLGDAHNLQLVALDAQFRRISVVGQYRGELLKHHDARRRRMLALLEQGGGGVPGLPRADGNAAL